MTPTRHLRVATPAPGVRLPTVEEIDAIPADLLPAVLVELAALQARAALRLRTEPAPAPIPPDHLLTIDEACAQLAVTCDWLRRRPDLPFIVKLSDGVVRYSARGLDAYLATLRR